MSQEFTLQTVTNVIDNKILIFASVPRDLQLGASVTGFGLPLNTYVAAFTDTTVTISNVVTVPPNTTITFRYNSGSVLKVSSDYKIKTPNGGTIRLDTGINVGQVFITGSLNVQGTTTTVNTENLDIEDKIILLNKGESGYGVSSGDRTSGIEIDRGTFIEGNGQFLWDENIEWWDPWDTQYRDGAWVSKAKNSSAPSAIRTHSIDTDGNDLALISRGNGIVTVRNTTNYERQVLNYSTGLSIIHDDTIPNIKAVVDKISYQIINDPGDKIKRDDTQVIVYDTNITAKIGTITAESSSIIRLDHFLITNNELNIVVGSYVTIIGSGITNLDGTWQVTVADTIAQFFKILVTGPVVAPGVLNIATNIIVNNTNSSAKVIIDGVLITEFQQGQVDLFNIRIQDTTISTTVSDTDLILTSPGSGNIQIQDSLKIMYTGIGGSGTPGIDVNCTKIYTDPEGPGGTGIYYVHPKYLFDKNDFRRDELISKKKAIAFAILM